MNTFDRRLFDDPQIGPKVFAGARALALHRMMRDGSKHWDDLSEQDKLNLCAEASVVMSAEVGAFGNYDLRRLIESVVQDVMSRGRLDRVGIARR